MKLWRGSFSFYNVNNEHGEASPLECRFIFSANTTMKKAFVLSFALLFCLLKGSAQNPVNWTNEQLLEPAVLAGWLQAKKELPALISVGPGATIPNSIHIGMTNDAANLANLKKKLQTMPKNASVVIYCGCCPFENCPNVRPAIAALQELKFANYKLLNIPRNIKSDWIDKGYPTAKP